VTNLQLYLAVGLPTVLLLLGQLFNFSSTKELRVSVESRLVSLESRLGSIESRLVVIKADLREFYRAIGKLEGRVDTIERGRT